MPLAGLPRLLIFVMVSPLLRQPAASAQALPECPTPAVRLLATTLGTWVVTWRDRVTPDRYDTTQARATIEPTARGCGLLERFEGTRDGRPFSALTLIGPGTGTMAAAGRWCPTSSIGDRPADTGRGPRPQQQLT
jgi:hypothetical protein